MTLYKSIITHSHTQIIIIIVITWTVKQLDVVMNVLSKQQKERQRQRVLWWNTQRQIVHCLHILSYLRTFIHENFHSLPRNENFRSLVECSSPGTFVPNIKISMELSIPITLIIKPILYMFFWCAISATYSYAVCRSSVCLSVTGRIVDKRGSHGKTVSMVNQSSRDAVQEKHFQI